MAQNEIEPQQKTEAGLAMRRRFIALLLGGLLVLFFYVISALVIGVIAGVVLNKKPSPPTESNDAIMYLEPPSSPHEVIDAEISQLKAKIADLEALKQEESG